MSEIQKWIKEDMNRLGKNMTGYSVRPLGSPPLVPPSRPDFKASADEMGPQLERAMSGISQIEPVAKGSGDDQEAIFAWALYLFRAIAPMTLKDFLVTKHTLDKVIPTPKSLIWGFSQLRTRGWISKDKGSRYHITSKAVVIIEKIFAGEDDIWKKYRKLEDWMRANPPPLRDN